MLMKVDVISKDFCIQENINDNLLRKPLLKWTKDTPKRSKI